MHFSLINHGILQVAPGEDIEIRIDKSQPHVVIIKEISGQSEYAVMDWVSSIMQKLAEEQRIKIDHSEAKIMLSNRMAFNGTFAMEREEWGAFVHYAPIIKTWNRTNAENNRDGNAQAQI